MLRTMRPFVNVYMSTRPSSIGWRTTRRQSFTDLLCEKGNPGLGHCRTEQRRERGRGCPVGATVFCGSPYVTSDLLERVAYRVQDPSSQGWACFEPAGKPEADPNSSGQRHIGMPSNLDSPVERVVHSVSQTFHRLRDPFSFHRNIVENLLGTAFSGLFLSRQADSFDHSCPPFKL